MSCTSACIRGRFVGGFRLGSLSEIALRLEPRDSSWFTPLPKSDRFGASRSMSARAVPDADPCIGALSKADRFPNDEEGPAGLRGICWVSAVLETRRRLSPALFLRGWIVLTLLDVPAEAGPKLFS